MKSNLYSWVGVVAFSGVLAYGATTLARADEYYRPVSQGDAVTHEECSACHLAYSPEMLPAASWRKLMSDLENHFGEDASLDAETNQHITKFLTQNAADSGWVNNRFMRGLDLSRNIPIRITETPYWRREHREEELREHAWRRQPVKSNSDCVACHRDAARGGYDDD